MHCVLPIHLHAQAGCVAKRVLYATPPYGLLPSAAAITLAGPQELEAERCDICWHACMLQSLHVGPPHILAMPPTTARWRVVRAPDMWA
jgi:hypothetical protein